MLSSGRTGCELGQIAEELRLPLAEDCSPPAQETLLGTLGSACRALPLIKDKPGFAYHLWPWAHVAPLSTLVVAALSRKESNVRIIGIDLATKAKHRAIIANERSRFISPLLKFDTQLADLERVWARALHGARPEEELVVVMEATDINWYPVAVYFAQRGATVHVVNPRLSADLGRFYKRHARSDRLSAKVLARLPLVSPDSVYPLVLSGAGYLALQRACQELDRLTVQISAHKNRLQAIDRLGWPGLKRRVFPSPAGVITRWFREHFYDPQRVVVAGVEGLRQAWRAADVYNEDETWIEPLLALAQERLTLYGDQGAYVDYEALSDEVCREQRRLAAVEVDAHEVRIHITRPRYRRLHPSRHLETMPGVGQDGAAVYTALVGAPVRFACNRAFRGWSGMVPRSRQSGESESKGLPLSQAGPNLIKKYAYLDADAARKTDPQIAAIYYDQMVHKGKHHTQAVCACATHLLDRVRIILTEDRPYELRDVDGTPLTREQARAIVAERYTVPDEVRQRNSRRARRERAEEEAEREEERRGRSR
jgi:transposase